jgi:hypothetical protein
MCSEEVIVCSVKGVMCSMEGCIGAEEHAMRRDRAGYANGKSTV